MVNILSLFENALTRESVQSGAGWEVMEEEKKKDELKWDGDTREDCAVTDMR